MSDHSLAGCADCACAQRGKKEERAKIVEHLRVHGLGLANDAKGRGSDLAAALVGFGATLLGAIAQGLADYFESGWHWEPTPEKKGKACEAVAQAYERSTKDAGAGKG